MEAATGARLLGEVEEMSMEEALDTLRTSLNGTSNKGPLKITHINELDQLAARHFRETQAPALAISGRYLPLLYKLASTLVSAPHYYAVLVIDLEVRFDATRLSCNADDARHIYVHRPSRTGIHNGDLTGEDGGGARGGAADHLRFLLSGAEKFMLYGTGAVSSASRRWWGTFVVGGLGAGDVVADWRGWLKVSREHVEPLSFGMSAEEALRQRHGRQEAVDEAAWVAESHWGNFSFREDG